MIKYENDCVGCEDCRGCGLKRVPHFYCDKCKWESDVLYYLDDEELCIDCITSKLQVVSAEE